MLTKISNIDGINERKHNFAIAKGKVIEHADSFSDKTDAKVSSLILGD